MFFGTKTLCIQILSVHIYLNMPEKWWSISYSLSAMWYLTCVSCKCIYSHVLYYLLSLAMDFKLVITHWFGMAELILTNQKSVYHNMYVKLLLSCTDLLACWWNLLKFIQCLKYLDDCIYSFKWAKCLELKYFTIL